MDLPNRDQVAEIDLDEVITSFKEIFESFLNSLISYRGSLSVEIGGSRQRIGQVFTSIIDTTNEEYSNLRKFKRDLEQKTDDLKTLFGGLITNLLRKIEIFSAGINQRMSIKTHYINFDTAQISDFFDVSKFTNDMERKFEKILEDINKVCKDYFNDIMMFPGVNEVHTFGFLSLQYLEIMKLKYLHLIKLRDAMTNHLTLWISGILEVIEKASLEIERNVQLKNKIPDLRNLGSLEPPHAPPHEPPQGSQNVLPQGSQHVLAQGSQQGSPNIPPQEPPPVPTPVSQETTGEDTHSDLESLNSDSQEDPESGGESSTNVEEQYLISIVNSPNASIVNVDSPTESLEEALEHLENLIEHLDSPTLDEPGAQSDSNMDEPGAQSESNIEPKDFYLFKVKKATKKLVDRYLKVEVFSAFTSLNEIDVNELPNVPALFLIKRKNSLACKYIGACSDLKVFLSETSLQDVKEDDFDSYFDRYEDLELCHFTNAPNYAHILHFYSFLKLKLGETL